MSQQAVGPLEPARLAPPPDSAAALVRLRDEVRELERELREIERRTQEAERRIEAEDLASPLARRAVALGNSIAVDIVQQGRADIRRMLADARVVADARLADALREAGEVLAGARAEVTEALQDRAAGVDVTLTEASSLPRADRLDAIVAESLSESPALPSAGGLADVRAVSDVETNSGPMVAVGDESSPRRTDVGDEPTPDDPGGSRRPQDHTGRNSTTVVGLLEASIAESVAVPLGSPVDAPPEQAAGVGARATRTLLPGAPASVAESTERSVVVAPGTRARLPDPPDPVGAPGVLDRGFADLAEPDSADPFAGDTPATTSEHIEALSDLRTPLVTSTAVTSNAVDPAAGTVAPEAGSGAESGPEAESGTAVGAPAGALGAVPGESFWGEQEAARRTHWLRPMEILVPLALALVLFVVLLLWIG